MKRLAAPLALLICLALAGPAHAATASLDGGVLRVAAGPGEANAIGVTPAADGVAVRDGGSPETLVAGAGCLAITPGQVLCAGALARVSVDAGDGDDQVQVALATPTRIEGGPGTDRLEGGSGPDSLRGGSGDDSMLGGEGADRLLGDRGRDASDGGPGADYIRLRDRKLDSALCGPGRDKVRAEVLDWLDFACERVDYGKAGTVGRLLPRTRGGRFVPVPGQGGAKVDKRILTDVLYLIRRYRVHVGAGFATRGHERTGEHPLGLAVDLYPGPGGSWRQVDRLARWAEPRQNRPRPPFRWVGYNGDKGHGRGDHLHLSWQHTPGRFGRPVRTVWVWQVKRR